MVARLQINRRRPRARWQMRKLWRDLVSLWWLLNIRDAHYNNTIIICTAACESDSVWQNPNCVVVIDLRNYCQYWRPQEKIHKIRKNWTRVNIFYDSWLFFPICQSVSQKQLASSWIYINYNLRLLQLNIVSLQCVWYGVYSHWRCYWPRGIFSLQFLI